MKKRNKTLGNKYIYSNPKIYCGEPVIKGTRIPVRIIKNIAKEKKVDFIKKKLFPELTFKQIEAAIKYKIIKPKMMDEEVELTLKVDGMVVNQTIFHKIQVKEFNELDNLIIDWLDKKEKKELELNELYEK